MLFSMDTDTAIEIHNVSKQYFVGQIQQKARYRTMRDVMMDALKRPLQRARDVATGQVQSVADLTHSIWALQDVSLSVKKGEVVGIIGHNGAGKSTLLKILSRITDPTHGEIAYRGRLGALLEVGTGFHPELTGRENVYLNGAILGMKRAEINARFDEIIGFAGVEQFVDTPVKHYSSGMYVRLAFAVAAHLEPEILIVDEVLSVGDAEFQKRSLGKMQDVAGSGRTVLFVSHNMAAVASLCDRGVLLDHGSVTAIGTSEDVIKTYQDSIADRTAYIPLTDRRDRTGSGALRYTRIAFRSMYDGVTLENNSATSGQPLQIRLGYQTKDNMPLHNVTIALHISDYLGRRLITCFTEYTGDSFKIIPAHGEFICEIPRLNLTAGHYQIELGSRVNGVVADRIVSAGTLDVLGGDFYETGKLPSATVHGPILLDHRWSVRDV
jgi:lipopolysaccharide transport system ATP-binding protein